MKFVGVDLLHLKRHTFQTSIENQKLEAEILQAFENSKRIYGSPRITLELHKKDIKISRPRVAGRLYTSNYYQLFCSVDNLVKIYIKGKDYYMSLAAIAADTVEKNAEDNGRTLTCISARSFGALQNCRSFAFALPK